MSDTESLIQRFTDLVNSRRSVRRFKPDRPISESVLKSCLELSLLAPNSSNLQPWKFYHVASVHKKKELATACLSQNAAKSAAALIVVTANPGCWKTNSQRILQDWPGGNPPKVVSDYYTSKVGFMYNPGFLNLLGLAKKAFAFCVGLVRPVPRGPFTRCGTKVWAVKSVALACAHFMLALKANGFDSCPMEGFDEARVRNIVGISRREQVVMVIGCGVADEKGVYNQRYRFPLQECFETV